MCGIFGAFATDAGRPASREVLLAMGQSLSHRGPDADGFHLDGELGMGMRRLSIIDLATGDQPIANEDQTVWLVFNGEIYNYQTLRTELVRRGHHFATASDTEVLVHLYEDHGEAFVERLRGMFAYALWDTRRRVLLLGRDRLGIKPLYYAETRAGLVFGSELKAILQSPWVGRRLSSSGIEAYLRWGYVPDPWSILADVRKLPPGHTLAVQHGRPGRLQRYWDPTDAFRNPGTIRSEEDAAERLEELLADAVRSHLVSDVPLGAFLSGGLDSTTVVSLMAREAGARVRTFSIGFREPAFDESAYARRVAEWFETDHHELIVEPDDLGALDEILGAFDEPFADPSAIPTYFVSRLARRHVKVALSGDGGDELFAGYDRYVADHQRRVLGLVGDARLGAPLRYLSEAMAEGTPGKNYLYNLSLPRLERYLDAVSIFPARAVERLLADRRGRNGAADPAPGFEAVLPSVQGLDPLSRLQALDLQTYLPGDILTKVDRMSMAVSLEARVPLLDHPLVEFAASLPPRLRFRPGETKYLLRRILQGKVPAEVLTRPKRGFAVPLEAWFSARLPGFFADVLGDGERLHEAGIAPAAVRELRDLYLVRGRAEHCRRLWALVVLDRALQRLREPVLR
jgi:asparagine synthase (glutamine-hydrolysing)